MKYTKPEVTVLALALSAVQLGGKPFGHPQDSDIPDVTTNGAYEADE
jgi:hypothetical protein